MKGSDEYDSDYLSPLVIGGKTLQVVLSTASDDL